MGELVKLSILVEMGGSLHQDGDAMMRMLCFVYLLSVEILVELYCYQNVNKL